MEMELKPSTESHIIDHIECSTEGTVGEVTSRTKCLKLLPTKRRLLLRLSHLLIICFVVSIAYSVLDSAVLPGSEIFALSLLYVLAYVGGKIMKLIRLPPLLGMLLAGFLFRNLSFIPYYKDITLRWASTLRGSALVVILLKAGIGLDAQQLKKLKRVVLQVAFMPCCVETITLGFASHFLLSLPWIWAIMLGFVISAVSPAVVVPSLLSLQEKHYGTQKGVPTLVIAAASVDDILAITGFSITLSISLATGSWVWSLGKGVLEPFAGFVFGLSCGCIFWYMPGKDISKSSCSIYRIVLLLCGGLAVMFSSKVLDFAGAGPFGCLVLGFVAALRWKRDSDTFSTIEDTISLLWKVLQPFLFSLIGCEVTITSLKKDIGNSIAALAIGCAFRTLTAFAATFGGGLNVKERLFIAFAWLPKATVQIPSISSFLFVRESIRGVARGEQGGHLSLGAASRGRQKLIAAVGPQALDYVLAYNKGPEMEDYAVKVLGVAVLSIILTAPLGAVLISLLGPVLLTRDEEKTEENPVETEEGNLQV